MPEIIVRIEIPNVSVRAYYGEDSIGRFVQRVGDESFASAARRAGQEAAAKCAVYARLEPGTVSMRWDPAEPGHTDLDKLRELLLGFGLKEGRERPGDFTPQDGQFATIPDRDDSRRKVLVLDEGHGFKDYYVDFEFDENGKFVQHGVRS